MPLSLADSTFRRWLVTVTVAIAATMAMPVLAEAADDDTRVLVLYSLRRDAQLVNIAERELPRILKEGLSAKVDYNSEVLDQARASQPQYWTALRELLRAKYEGRRFDLVIAIGDVPLEFIEQNRNTIFSGAPVVTFSGASRQPRRLANSTGVIGDLDVRGTLDLITQLQPDTRQVFVLAGAASADQAYESQVRAEAASYKSGLTIRYLSGLPASDLEKQVAALPEHSVIYFLLVQRDSTGRTFLPLDYLDRITAIANVPVYSWVDSTMGHGVVGGSFRSQVVQMTAVGTKAVRVLRGERADDIPVASPNLSVRQVDWRQLRRWDIAESRVPPGVEIRFKEASIWDLYRFYILGGLVVMLAQTGLIAGLLVHRRKRRQTEDELRRREAQLRESYDRLRDLGARLLHAQEEERSRIARELHDDLGQQLTLLTLDIETLGSTVGGPVEALASKLVTRIDNITRSTHDLSHRLHPAKLRLLGLVSAIEGLRKELASPNIAIAFAHHDVPSSLPPDLTLCLFRIAQEALQNALKYSRAHTVSVDLRRGPDGLVLTIVDDGVGFDIPTSWARGLGLVSMRERLDSIGGGLEIQSARGMGTRICAKVPHDVIGDARAASA